MTTPRTIANDEGAKQSPRPLANDGETSAKLSVKGSRFAIRQAVLSVPANSNSSQFPVTAFLRAGLCKTLSHNPLDLCKNGSLPQKGDDFAAKCPAQKSPFEGDLGGPNGARLNG